MATIGSEWEPEQEDAPTRGSETESSPLEPSSETDPTVKRQRTAR